MHMADFRFELTDWSTIEPTIHLGESGTALWRTRQFGAIRVRMVDYDGRKLVLTPGVSYQVADHAEPHKSSTRLGAKLFIVD